MEGLEHGKVSSSPTKSRFLEGHCETEQQSLEQLEIHEHESSDKRSHHIYYLKIFLDLGYFLLVIPFRLKLKHDRITGRRIYKLHHNRLQQITCAVFQVIVIFELFSVLRLVPSFNEMHKKPKNILQSGNLVASLIYTLSLVYIFWFKRSNLENICVQLQEIENLYTDTKSDRWKRIQVKLLVYVICIAAYLMAATHPVIHEAFVFESDLATFSFERMSMQAKACFLMTDPEHVNANFNFYDWRTVPALVFTCIHTIILIPSAVLVHMLDLFALLTTICCWDVMKSFMRRCKVADHSIQNGEEYLPSILSRYAALKKLFKTVNDGIGLLFLCCVGISLPIYATWIAVQFFDNTVKAFDAIHFYVYFLTFLFVLSMAARINQRANEFYDWIGSSELHTIIPTNKMTVLMMDSFSNRISLSGCGIFVINFRFLVTILSIIVTYTSIIVQFQMSRTQCFEMEKMGNETYKSAW